MRQREHPDHYSDASFAGILSPGPNPRASL